jgi:two-component system sensor histidine kinase BaeS
LDRYRPRFVERRIAIETVLAGVEQTPIRGDADRLGQVFTNLFENVFRYVASPGSLKISGAVENHLLTILFEDSGPGVPEEALPRLFDRLYRVEASRNRASGGSGLGLSICRHIIEIHGGSIWAAKSPQGGLSIGIHLPLAERGAR